ncbi:MAG TPA: helicase C-terminal domain-containing protein [Solirubrobacterales bacterium]|nr:helicase C-terminal domain-containing protein [Solirubrobacterales bacterium]
MEMNVYTQLFEEHASDSIRKLWPWQEEVLEEYASVEGDAAIELPTGAGKTLVGLLAGEHHRSTHRGRVAYLAGNKQLAQQVERQASELGFPVVRFEGSKDEWDQATVRKYNFGQAIGVMNYWNYFNAAPGIEPAGKLILDDVHLLEGPLRDRFTVSIPPSDSLLSAILKLIVGSYPYYARADDLLNEVIVSQPPEMLAFPDSADLADEVRDLLDAGIPERTQNWWAWQNIREQLEVCCWLVSGGGVTFTPYIPPTQTLEHFRVPTSRLYLSATIGTVDDLQRRLGAPPLVLIDASAQPKQGERLVVIRDETENLDEPDLVESLRPILENQKKALWLCARKETAANVRDALLFSGLDGEVRVLEGDNAADEPFAEEDAGHLVMAGRYDGMDFPGDACRLEVIPEIPVATSALEEFVAAFLRDAPFAQARFGQRVAQALGRCNRTEDDRAVYVLTDPEFLGRFSQQRIVDVLPGHVRNDVLSAAIRADDGFQTGLGRAENFLVGESPDPIPLPERGSGATLPPTATEEVEGSLALWTGDYQGAADLFDNAAATLTEFGEYRGFWLSMRALALKRAADFGDKTAIRLADRALKAAVAAGGRNVFFTRLRLSEARSEEGDESMVIEGVDDLFSAWDRLMDRNGTGGPRFKRWADRLLADLRSQDHDTVARAIARVGEELLGLGSGTPQAKSGEEDAYWELLGPRRLLTFEVKLAPKKHCVVNDDVEQAEGAAKAVEGNRGYAVRGLLVTPHETVEDTALARLERVRLVQVEVFAEEVEKLLAILARYRREWGDSAADRNRSRSATVSDLPPLDWFWHAILGTDDWVDVELLDQAWDGRGP